MCCIDSSQEKFASEMEEIVHELNYAYHRRHENMVLAWNLMRSTLERHTGIIESLATAYNNSNDPHITDTELLIQSRQFYHPQTISIALLFLNAQYENFTESISSVLIQDTLRLIQYLDTETSHYGSSEGNSFVFFPSL